MKIIVIGAGFAGCAAIGKLKKLKGLHQLLLFDKNSYTTMIPSLPDLAGGKFPDDMLREEISRFIPEWVILKNEKIPAVDLDNKTVISDKTSYQYDYLIIATGSVTNFYGFAKQLSKIYKIDCLDDARRTRDDFIDYLAKNPKNCHVVISGAGYTGLELACSLRYLAERKGRNMPITIVEMAEDILFFLNHREKIYIKNYLNASGIRVMFKSRITDFDGQNVMINNEIIIKNVFLSWTAGSKFAIENVVGDVERISDGRIVVNQFLQLLNYPGVFAAGDSAAIKYKNTFLRKAVNFALGSGRQAGENLVRLINRKRMIKYKPVDLGWVIPLQEISMGRILNKIPVKGKLGLRLHYLFSGYFNYNLRNFLAYLKVAIKLF